MSKKTIARNSVSRAILIYDGANWLLYPIGESAPVMVESAAGDTLPPQMAAWLQQNSGVLVRFLLSGEVTRSEMLLPPRVKFSELTDLMLQEMSELSGIDTPDVICAADRVSWPGTIQQPVLAGTFDTERILGLRRLLETVGAVFDGVGSLELACMAAGSEAGKNAPAMLIVSAGTALAVPARKSKLPHDGPLPFSGGIRHLASDAEGWTARFRRTVHFLDRTQPLTVIVPGNSDPGIATVLHQECDFAEVRIADRGDLFALAVRLAFGVRANRTGQAFPIANPYEPRKRFSHAWIVLPTILLIGLPFCMRLCTEFYSDAKKESLQAEIARYLPVESRILRAERKALEAQKACEHERLVRLAMAERRVPMSAFVKAAYFFCRHVGATVYLQELREENGIVQAIGSYTDPEDGLDMNAKLTEIARLRGFRILRNATSEEADAEGMPITRFEILLEYIRED